MGDDNLEYRNIQEAKALLKEKFDLMVQKMMGNFERIFKPFYFTEIKEIID